MCATRNQLAVPENFYRPAHGRTLNWYVRLVPPKALRGVAGVKEYRQSTGTADLRRAKTIGTRLIADKRAEWDKLLQTISAQATQQVLTEELIEHLCAQRVYHWLRLDDRGRFEGAGFDEQSERALLELCEVTDRTMQAVVRRGPASPEWAEVLDLIDAWCVQLGYSVPRTDPRYPQLVRAYSAAERQAVELVRRRFAGDGVATPAQPAGPLVVSCGTQQSESLVVVEPGGHVGRLPLSLSTCPRGGFQEHGFER